MTNYCSKNGFCVVGDNEISRCDFWCFFKNKWCKHETRHENSLFFTCTNEEARKEAGCDK